MSTSRGNPSYKNNIYIYIIYIIYIYIYMYMVGDISVRIATRYGLDGRGSNPGRGEIFCTRPDQPWGPPSLLYKGYRLSFLGVKRLGRGVKHPPQSSTEVKARVELYLYSPSRLSWPVLGRTLHIYKWLSAHGDYSSYFQLPDKNSRDSRRIFIIFCGVSK
jgi:hypothetical protein